MNRFRPGNRITLLRSGGEYFPALVGAIDRAEREVWLETYIFADDDVGRIVTAALVPRGGARRRSARAGRRLGRRALPHRGFEARARPRRASRCSSTVRKSRRGSSARTGCAGSIASLCHVDGRIAFVGGINIIDDVNTPGIGRRASTSRCRIEGPLLVTDRAHDAARLGDQRAGAVPAERRAAVSESPRSPRSGRRRPRNS